MLIKPRWFRPRRSFAFITFIAVLALICVRGIAGQDPKELTPQEKHGKQIYLTGTSDSGEMIALLGSANLEVPASAMPCANCHGANGQGSSEGGIQASPLHWSTLTRAYRSGTAQERPAYDEATLARSITDALDPAGKRLHAGMPAYKMSRGQVADLIAYLKIIEAEADKRPSVDNARVKVGAALPLTGPLAQVGADIKATLEATFAQTNVRGGIYGRKFDLVVEDSGGEPAQTLAATRKLIDRHSVLALIASFEPGDSNAINQLFKERDIPLVGPVTLSPRMEQPPNPYVFYLLPTFAHQARTLVDFVRSQPSDKPASLAVIYSDNAFNQDALDGLKAQASLYAMRIASEQKYEAGNFKAGEAVALLSKNKPRYVFFFGGGQDFKALAAEMDRVKLNVPLLSSVVMIGREAFAIPASVSSQTFLSYPATLPNENDFAEFLVLMGAARVPLRSPAFQSVAYAAVKLFIEAAKLSGKDLNRRSLINSLERIHEFKTGVVPPLTYGPNRRVGSVSSYIVGIDSAKRQYVPLTIQLEPKEKP